MDYQNELSTLKLGESRRWDDDFKWHCDGSCVFASAESASKTSTLPLGRKSSLFDDAPFERFHAVDPLLREMFQMFFICPGHLGGFVKKRVILYDERVSARLVSDLLLFNYHWTNRNVKIVPLAEALKVRVITKGPALAGYLMMPFQKYLHGVLKRHPVTQLIGTPITSAILNSRLVRLHDNERWLSGDYQDATNGMFSYISNHIADCLVDRILSDDFDWITRHYIHRCFFDLLTGHTIEDPDNPGTFVPQENGQLMGSVLSFPVLCIANIVLCRMAYEIGHGGRKVSLKKIPLLVNGDDCVFPATLEVEQSWRTLCLMFGMLPSVGKVYYSDDFLNINSTTFLYRPGYQLFMRGENSIWAPTLTNFIHVYHVNWGLIMLRKRSGTQIEKSDIFSQFSNISSYSRDLLDTCPALQADCLYELFIRNYGSFAAENGIRLPWFVPRCYGGVGIHPFGKWSPSLKDQTLCLMMFGKENFRVNNKDMVWKFHKNYQDFTKNVDKEINDSDAKAYRDFNQIEFLHSLKDLSRIFNSQIASTGIRLLRNAERTWNRYLHQLKYLKPFDIWAFTDDPTPICIEQICDPIGVEC